MTLAGKDCYYGPKAIADDRINMEK